MRAERTDVNFPDKLSSLLKTRRMSQMRLSGLTGIAQPSISAMRLGERRPYMDQGLNLARALGVSLDYLADDSLDLEPSAEAVTKDEARVLKLFRILKSEEI